MDAAVHLPQADLTGAGLSARRVDDVARAALANGFGGVSANDHFVFPRPWLDGLTLLARVSPLVGDLDLATSVALSPLRGPVPLASALSTLARLADGRVVAGIGPGSSREDYAAVGLDFEDRWARFDESVRAMRSLLGPDGPAMWLASWGSPAGLRRVARLGDGWFASAYNTDPARFAAALATVQEERARLGLAGDVGAALATMWTYVTESPAEAERMLADVLAPALGRDPEKLRGSVCIGPAEQCVTLLARYAEAGCRRVHFWPVTDETAQLDLLASRVLPQVSDSAPAASRCRARRRQ